VQEILDIGCSVGISLLSKPTGYPCSYHRLRLIALYADRCSASGCKGEIAQWLHANAEETGLPDVPDLVTLQFVIHELPRQATTDFWEALLYVPGHLAIIDNNPQSPVIQNLPPVLFTLMKSTEPWSDDYIPWLPCSLLALNPLRSPVTLAILGRKP